MFILVENVGVAALESFTLLGASGTRGTQGVGQFGTGAKHAINVSLRFGLKFHIYLGEQEIVFFAKPRMVNGKAFRQVWYTVDGVEHATSWTLEFGELDWKDASHALREVICNAIDAVGWDNMVVDTVTEARGKAGMTRIYLEAAPELLKYFGELEENFLFHGGRQDQTILSKSRAKKIRAYRRGVLVYKGEENSLFDYNTDFEVDECRVATTENIKAVLPGLIAEDPAVLASILVEAECLERDLDWYRVDLTRKMKNVREAWEIAFGSDAVLCLNKKQFSQASKHGIKGIYVEEYPLREMLDHAKVKKLSDVLSDEKMKGITILDPTPQLSKRVRAFWDRLTTAGLQGEKPFPGIHLFEVEDGANPDNQPAFVLEESILFKDSTWHSIVAGISMYVVNWNRAEWLCKVVAKISYKEE